MMQNDTSHDFKTKNMKKCILFFPLMLNCISCWAQSQTFDWLTGTWKLEDKPVYEVWKKNSDQGWEGVSYEINGQDTIIQEKMSIINRDGNFHYIPDVAENSGVVDFVMTSVNKRSFVAENPEHDFPKVIRYTIVRKAGKEFINASIEGNGKIVHYTFEKSGMK
jgi:hypothetical protein